MSPEDLIIFRVDFNNIGEISSVVKGSLRNASSRRLPRVGERVYLRDFEGNACFARVRSVTDRRVAFELDAGTWTTTTQVVSGVRAPAMAVY